MRIAVCSIMYNEVELLPAWLDSLLAIEDIKEIHLVDCASIDNSVRLAMDYNPRVTVEGVTWDRDFSRLRNSSLKLINKDIEWVMMPDIDEMFCGDAPAFFEYLNDQDLSNYNCVEFPHIKFWDWNKVWFHKPPTTPNIDLSSSIVEYSIGKCTMTLFRKEILQGFKGSLHEDVVLSEPRKPYMGSIFKTRKIHIDKLREDFFMGHYSKAKMHEKARKQHTTLEHQVGLKRSRYRQITPVTYYGRTYTPEMMQSPNRELIEQLGKDQLQTFLDDHVFVGDDFNSWELNNDSIKEHFKNEQDTVFESGITANG